MMYCSVLEKMHIPVKKAKSVRFYLSLFFNSDQKITFSPNLRLAPLKLLIMFVTESIT